MITFGQFTELLNFKYYLFLKLIFHTTLDFLFKIVKLKGQYYIYHFWLKNFNNWFTQIWFLGVLHNFLLFIINVWQ